jgi:hypothetical protein
MARRQNLQRHCPRKRAIQYPPPVDWRSDNAQ